jgi:hypothetical protein
MQKQQTIASAAVACFLRQSAEPKRESGRHDSINTPHDLTDEAFGPPGQFQFQESGFERTRLACEIDNGLWVPGEGAWRQESFE